MDINFDDLIPKNGKNNATVDFNDLIPQQPPQPQALLSAAPEPSAFQRFVDGLQESGILPKGQANQIRRNSHSVGAAIRGARQGATFGAGEEIIGALDAVNPASDNFGELQRAIGQQRQQIATDRVFNPIASGVGEIAGGVASGATALKAGLTASRFAPQAAQGLRGTLGRAAAAGVDGAAIGGVQALNDQRDVGRGALTGALTATGLQGAAEAASGVVGNVARKIQNRGLSPEQRVNENIVDQINSQGGREFIQQQLAQSPDTVLADVLPGAGRQLRNASNFSPDAQQLVLERLIARRGGQNERIVDDLNNVVGLRGDETVEGLQEAIGNRFQPRESAAFNAARESGATLDRTNIDPILQGPFAQTASRGGDRIAANQVARLGPQADNDLNRLHTTIRRLGGQGVTAQRQGANDIARENFATQSDLRNAVDDALNTDDFQNARKLSQRRFQRQSAVQSGADLAKRTNRTNRNAANAFDQRFRGQQQKGFVAQLTDTLEQGKNTASDVNKLASPASAKAIGSIFNPQQQQQINQSFARERGFNKTLGEVSGNSTTAQQVLDASNGQNTQQIIDALSNLSTGGVSGALRSGARAVAGATFARGQRQQALPLTELLTGSNIPESQISRLTPQQLQQRQQIIDLLSRSGAVALP